MQQVFVKFSHNDALMGMPDYNGDADDDDAEDDDSEDDDADDDYGHKWK